MPWQEWGRLTRFLESTRFAFVKEADRLARDYPDDPDATRIRAVRGRCEYQVSLRQHRSAVTDETTLHGCVLVFYYSLAEAAAFERLKVRNVRDGIAVWGERLLTSAGSDWTKVKDGMSGAVEVAVVRNLFGHGRRLYDQRSIDRLRKANVANVPALNSPLQLEYELLLNYRARLKSLLRHGKI